MANPRPSTPSTAAAQSSNEDRYKATMNVQLQILTEMQQLNEFNRKIHGQPPLKSKELWNFLLQFFGLLAATVFGVFAILAWVAADRANQMADFATELASSANALASSANFLASSGNQLAATARADAAVANILAIWERCEATPTGTAVQTILSDPCESVKSAMSNGNAFLMIADQYFTLDANDDPRTTTSSTSRPTPTPTPGDAVVTKSPGVIAGAVIGGLAGLVLLIGMAYLPYQTYRAQLRRARELTLLKAEQEQS